MTAFDFASPCFDSDKWNQYLKFALDELCWTEDCRREEWGSWASQSILQDTQLLNLLSLQYKMMSGLGWELTSTAHVRATSRWQSPLAANRTLFSQMLAARAGREPAYSPLTPSDCRVALKHCITRGYKEGKVCIFTWALGGSAIINYRYFLYFSNITKN